MRIERYCRGRSLAHRSQEVVHHMTGMAARGRLILAARRAGRLRVRGGRLLMRVRACAVRLHGAEPDGIGEDHQKQKLEHEKAQTAIHAGHSTRCAHFRDLVPLPRSSQTQRHFGQ